MRGGRENVKKELDEGREIWQIKRYHKKLKNRYHKLKNITMDPLEI